MWNRRDFNVSPNGYFSVLRPAGWFSAVRLPGGFRYVLEEPKRSAAAGSATARTTLVPSPDGAGGAQAAEYPLQVLKTGEREHGPVRPVLIAFVATAITSILLWCIEHP